MKLEEASLLLKHEEKLLNLRWKRTVFEYERMDMTSNGIINSKLTMRFIIGKEWSKR